MFKFAKYFNNKKVKYLNTYYKNFINKLYKKEFKEEVIDCYIKYYKKEIKLIISINKIIKHVNIFLGKEEKFNYELINYSLSIFKLKMDYNYLLNEPYIFEEISNLYIFSSNIYLKCDAFIVGNINNNKYFLKDAFKYIIWYNKRDIFNYDNTECKWGDVFSNFINIYYKEYNEERNNYVKNKKNKEKL